jgi:hypothetical protein
MKRRKNIIEKGWKSVWGGMVFGAIIREKK